MYKLDIRKTTILFVLTRDHVLAQVLRFGAVGGSHVHSSQPIVTAFVAAFTIGRLKRRACVSLAQKQQKLPASANRYDLAYSTAKASHSAED